MAKVKLKGNMKLKCNAMLIVNHRCTRGVLHRQRRSLPRHGSSCSRPCRRASRPPWHTSPRRARSRNRSSRSASGASSGPLPGCTRYWRSAVEETRQRGEKPDRPAPRRRRLAPQSECGWAGVGQTCVTTIHCRETDSSVSAEWYDSTEIHSFYAGDECGQILELPIIPIQGWYCEVSGLSLSDWLCWALSVEFCFCDFCIKYAMLKNTGINPTFTIGNTETAISD